jgi:hypothetical protein
MIGTTALLLDRRRRRLRAQTSQRWHVGQPAWAAGEVVGAQMGIELAADRRSGVCEEVLADCEHRQ